jgi:superfamily I DNA/RNA helicase
MRIYMPKEKWMINPGELDDFQKEIRSLNINDSYIVKGCAGSGKTILALYRANDIRIQSKAEGVIPSFTVVVFTKTLKSFIRSGIRDLGINLKQVIHYEKWDASAVDYVIVDEAQDFTQSEIDTLSSSANKSIMLYGDSQQQIYGTLREEGVLTIEAIAAHLGLTIKELKINYRLPKLIASFAAHLSKDKDLESRCFKPGSNKPKLINFLTWKEELDFIISEIRTRNYTDTAILLPFNEQGSARLNNFHRNVESVTAYLREKGFPFEFKMRTDDKDDINLDFDSELPKVLTYHSAKGLQFETVFVPFCDYPQHDSWFIKRYQNPLYVALTRPYRNLYLSYSERLTPFFADIDSIKYE